MGTRKLPSTAGIDGIRKKKTITMPCMLNSLVVGVRPQPDRQRSQQFQTDERAKNPPMKNMNVIEIRYRSAMRL